MAIAFDAATSGGTVTLTTSRTFSHTCTGSDGLLVVSFGTQTVGSDLASGVTYNGVAMTQLDKAVSASQIVDGYFYYLLGPATGANNIVISLSSSGAIYSCAASWTGVSATGQPDAQAKVMNNTGNNTASATTVADNCWMIGCWSGYDSGAAPGAGTGATRRTFEATNGAAGIFDSNGDIHPAGSYSMTVTNSATFKNALILGSFKPVGGAPSAVGPLTGGGSLQHGTLIRGGRLVTMPVRAPALWMPDRRIAA